MKNLSKLMIPFCIISFSMITSCKKKGCTDSAAINYNAKAEKDDGSCVYNNSSNDSNNDSNNDDTNSNFTCVQLGAECLTAEKIVENTEFDGRIGHGCIVFNNKIYIIGGAHRVGSTIYSLNDVWSSSDGTNWNLEVSEAPFSKRANHAVLVHDNKLWVIGGSTYGAQTLNDVWYSTDGINWVEATANAQFSKRQFHQAISFQNNIYLIGGSVIMDNGEVWKSSDGITWSLVTSNTGYGGRTNHNLALYDNKMWLFAGNEVGLIKRDVWSSSDAINWTKVNTQEHFTTRTRANSFIHNNNFYTLGGTYGNAHTTNIRNDLWMSTDEGVSWTQYAAKEVDFLERTSYKAVPFNNHIYIIGGRVNDVDAEDIWRIELP